MTTKQAPIDGMPSGFRIDGGHLLHDSGKGKAAKTTKVSSRITPIALGCNADSNKWSLAIEFKDPRGRTRRHLVIRSEVTKPDTIRELQDIGLTVDNHNLLQRFLSTANPSDQFVLAEKPGWLVSKSGECIGYAYHSTKCLSLRSTAEVILLHPRWSTGPVQERILGTLPEWQEDIAKHCEGQTLLIAGLSTAFAALAMGLDPEVESGGLHFVGSSSIGKSTALYVAESVGGLAHKSWRITDNALEGIAEQCNDSCLCLDELKQADPDMVGDSIYMLTQGMGKVRSDVSGTNRPVTTWRTMLVSTGEIGLSAIQTSSNKKGADFAGQAVRFIEIDSNIHPEYGALNHISTFPSSKYFVEHIRNKCRIYRGSAGLAFVETICSDFQGSIDRLSSYRNDIMQSWSSMGHTKQQGRILKRLAFIAASGELAVRYGILPFKTGHVTKIMGIIAKEYTVPQNGLSASRETIAVLERIEDVINTYGQSRFGTGNKISVKIDECYGYRLTPERTLLESINSDKSFHYYFTTKSFGEIIRGRSSKAVKRELKELGVLMVDPKCSAYSEPVHIPNQGKAVRLYHIDQNRLFEILAEANNEQQQAPDLPLPDFAITECSSLANLLVANAI